MSTHQVLVKRIEIIDETPDRLDRLSLARVGPFVSLVERGRFRTGDLVVVVEPDYVLPDEPDKYGNLAGKRITPRMIRGHWSECLVLPIDVLGDAAHVAEEDDDVLEYLGITRYEPTPPPSDLPGVGGLCVSPSGNPLAYRAVVYDLENIWYFAHAFFDDENVYVTEKIHGCNARFALGPSGDTLWVGSRTQWKLPMKVTSGSAVYDNHEVPPTLWHDAVTQNQWILHLCMRNPDIVFYGEVFGDRVQSYSYGLTNGRRDIRLFDAMYDGQFMSSADFVALVPEQYRVPRVMQVTSFDIHKLANLANATDSLLCPGLPMEGLVIKPWEERRTVHPRTQKPVRVAMKLVSSRFLEETRPKRKQRKA